MPRIRGFARRGRHINLYLEETHPLIYLLCKFENTAIQLRRIYVVYSVLFMFLKVVAQKVPEMIFSLYKNNL